MKHFKQIVLLLLTVTSTYLSAENFIDELTTTKSDPAPYRPTSERQLEYETPGKILSSLSSRGISTKYWDYWNQMVSQEERGFFGYHAAKQQFRIYQDIIKVIFEEILEIEIKKDFYFFRIPLEPSINEHRNSQNFLESYPVVNDGIPEQRDQLLSLNYTIFGNYLDGSQCSVCYFVNNQSWYPINYEKKLEFLFNELGMPNSEISTLFAIGTSIKYQKTGVLYQFFDTSHYTPNGRKAYELVDNVAYPSINSGPFDTDVVANLSDVYQALYKKKFDRNRGQVRLIMNTTVTMNPYSGISIRRYEETDREIVKKYEEELRNKIRQLSRSLEKIKIYKKQLEA